MATTTDKAEDAGAWLRSIAPGLGLCAVVSVGAVLLEPRVAQLARGSFAPPAMVIALIMGVIFSRFAARPVFKAGMTWCVKSLLRIAIALLGLRVALGDIAAIGAPVIALVAGAMALTIVVAITLSRMLRRGDGYGALAGAASAVCGASATLATATVVPDYESKPADIAFTVIAANLIATLGMIAYPLLCTALGFDERTTGIMLGATIHDVAQVAGAGYAVSEPAGNAAVVVKLFRVFLLLPVVLAIGLWFVKGGKQAGDARVPVPMFAVVFLVLALINSAAPLLPAALPAYMTVKAGLGLVSTWGLLLAIAALGLGTSPSAILAIGWRHLVVFLGATLTILISVTAGLLLIG